MRMITMLTPFPSGCLTYPLKRAGHVFPALCPGHVTLEHLPLGQSPSLHRLRSRTGGFVRQLRKYYGTVRLPVSVHHRCASLDFPMRSGIPSLPDKHGISRFPLKMLTYMLRVSDRAGSKSVSRYQRSSLAFRSVQQRRHPGVAIAGAMVVQFRGSIPGLHAPLSTLHPRPYARRYMTRGQCGALLLHCMKLSFTTPCRLLPAHLNLEPACLFKVQRFESASPCFVIPSIDVLPDPTIERRLVRLAVVLSVERFDSYFRHHGCL